MTNKRKMSDESLDELEFPVPDDTEAFEEVMEGMNANSPLEYLDPIDAVAEVMGEDFKLTSTEGLKEAIESICSEPTLTPEELLIAKALKGKPEKAMKSQKDVLNKLVKLNIAANFGEDDGYGRGFKWKSYVK